jgi:hypothetical protein
MLGFQWIPKNQEGGEMYRGAGLHGGVVSTVETGAYDEALPGVDCHRMLDERYSALPIIEISDKDYRSFCWPCHALEDTGDGQLAGT